MPRGPCVKRRLRKSGNINYISERGLLIPKKVVIHKFVFLPLVPPPPRAKKSETLYKCTDGGFSTLS
jgi:hypothetical protein